MRIPSSRTLLLALGLACGRTAALFAQDGTTKPPYPSAAAWVDVGVSAGTYSSYGAALAFTRVTPERVWRTRIHVQSDETLLDGTMNSHRRFRAVALEIGRSDRVEAIGAVSSEACHMSTHPRIARLALWT